MSLTFSSFGRDTTAVDGCKVYQNAIYSMMNMCVSHERSLTCGGAILTRFIHMGFVLKFESHICLN